MKWIAILIMALMTTSVVIATTLSTDYHYATVMVGTGAITNYELSEVNISYGITQTSIGNYTGTLEIRELGVFYISTLGNVTIAIPPPPLLAFIIYIKQRGMEHMWINWTG